MLATLLALCSAPAPRGPAARAASQLLVEQTGQGESQEPGVADDQLCDDVVCAGKAFCYEGVCYCAPGYQPPDCLVDICAGHVNGSDDGCHASEGHGSCVAGKCACNAGWGGDDCALDSCPGHCNGHGACVTGGCACNASWAGDGCDVPPPAPRGAHAAAFLKNTVRRTSCHFVCN